MNILILNSEYYVIDKYQYTNERNTIKYLSFSIAEIEALNNIGILMPPSEYYKYTEGYYTAKIKHFAYIDGISKKGAIIAKINIFKQVDNWYIVSLIFGQKMKYTQNVYSTIHYKCDQFSIVLQLLRDLDNILYSYGDTINAIKKDKFKTILSIYNDVFMSGDIFTKNVT